MFEKFADKNLTELAYPANAMAIEENTVVIKVPAKSFLELTSKNTDICLKMLASFAKRLRFLNSHIESVTLDDVTKRLAKYLIIEINKEHPQRQNNKSIKDNFIELVISKYDLASHLGTITETLPEYLENFRQKI